MESDCAAKELAKVNSYLKQGSRVGCGAIHGMYTVCLEVLCQSLPTAGGLKSAI